MSSTESKSEMKGQQRLFWGCFIALTATAFAFIIRIMVLNTPAFQARFNLTETQVGEITGAGIWPFGVSIVLFSLVIDRIGYRKAIIFAFVGHAAFGLMMIFANGYTMLYTAAILSGLAAGAVEAAINPVVATMFHREKTKWLSILHAGWPAGFVVAGLISITLGESVSWQFKTGLMFLPVLAYGAMLSTCHFPVTERVKKGVSHMEMLKQVGFAGAFIAIALIFLEVGRTFGLDVNGEDRATVWSMIAATSLGFGLYTRSFGHPIFVILTITMIPLAITELSVDNWITMLMESDMKEAGANPLWVLVFTMCIMMSLRFCAGAILHRVSPLGLLAISSALAILGLMFLSKAEGIGLIFGAATVYACGKTFFWPTMLGVVSEQCPKGGAMTLNLISGVGMLAAGVVGHQLIGNRLDTETAMAVQEEMPAIHASVLGDEKPSLFGSYKPLDSNKRKALEADKATEAEKKAAAEINAIEASTRKSLLFRWTVFPFMMLLSYIGLLLYFKSRGGYRPVDV